MKHRSLVPRLASNIMKYRSLYLSILVAIVVLTGAILVWRQKHPSADVIRPTISQTYSVSGKITWTNGTPAANVEVTIGQVMTITDENGWYAVSISDTDLAQGKDTSPALPVMFTGSPFTNNYFQTYSAAGGAEQKIYFTGRTTIEQNFVLTQ